MGKDHSEPCAALQVAMNDIEALKKELKDHVERINSHSSRLGALETGQTKLSTLMEGINQKLENIAITLENGFADIKKQYVTKDSLEVLIKDGKYSKLVWTVIGGVLGAIAITVIMGIFSSTANL